MLSVVLIRCAGSLEVTSLSDSPCGCVFKFKVHIHLLGFEWLSDSRILQGTSVYEVVVCRIELIHLSNLILHRTQLLILRALENKGLLLRLIQLSLLL